ncbi:hypothetical protein [Sphingomonas sp. VDB2]|uniref:hypothetical protein n=1 Tax=Sphingomonas sp. VDB2 TaxID=3228751 RepID=UPI003A800681
MTIKKSVDTSDVKLSDVPGEADTKALKVDDLAPATDVAASGALIEPTIVERIDTAHPAVDNEPRKGATIASNQIDFNTPSGLTTLEDEVVKNLGGAPKAAEDEEK